MADTDTTTTADTGTTTATAPADSTGPKTFVWRTRLPGLAAHDTFPGQVRAEEGRLHVACGDDRYVELLALQPEGGPELDAAGYLAARAHA